MKKIPDFSKLSRRIISRDHLRSMTEKQVEEAARRDPDNPPLTKEQLSRMKRVKK